MISATIIVFENEHVALTGDLSRLKTVVRSLIRENGDYTTLEVLSCFDRPILVLRTLPR